MSKADDKPESPGDDAPETTREKRADGLPVGRPFKSGNPGRPTGSRNKLGEAFVKMLQEDFDKNGQDAIDRVRAEKPDAYLRTIAAVLPVPKSRAVQIELPELRTSQDGLDAINIIIGAVSAGELSMDEGQQLAALVGEHRKATEMATIEARLSELERQRQAENGRR